MLIDFVEGALSPGTAGEIEAHLEACEACRAYVESLQRTFSLLSDDRVPEPPEAFFAYMAGRARAGEDRRRLLLRFLPGVASAGVVAVLMWWLAGTSLSPVDSVDIIMADMTTGQIVETVSMDPEAGELLAEDPGGRIGEIEAYLRETESIHDLLDSMSEAERERFTAHLERSMTGELDTSGHTTGSMRKEC
jgi:hypothetical protein